MNHGDLVGGCDFAGSGAAKEYSHGTQCFVGGGHKFCFNVRWIRLLGIQYGCVQPYNCSLEFLSNHTPTSYH